jgi:hypothetical protein
MYELVVKEEPIDSPIDKSIGDPINFSGRFIDGPKSGTSKIVRIYQEMLYKGEERYINEVPETVWAELENGRLVLLGFMSADGTFKISKNYLNQNNND